MRLFSRLYERALAWAAHPRAPWYLGALSFAESSFFPVPPDVMLAPMTLARPEAGWRYALLTTLSSVAGGVAGYLLGFWGMEAIEPWIRELGYWESYQAAVDWFGRWGFWAVLLAGFSPIPYKIFTLSAGALELFFPGFLLASVVGRGARFYLVAGLIRWGGEPMAAALRRHVDTIGWTVVLLSLVGYVIYRLA